MVDCDFCGTNITPGTGKMFVRKEGSVLRFCSSKCEKSMNKRKFKARITPWTAEFARVKKQKLSK